MATVQEMNAMIDREVKDMIYYLNQCGFEANEDNVWTNDIYNYQLYHAIVKRVGEKAAKYVNSQVRKMYGITKDNTEPNPPQVRTYHSIYDRMDSWRRKK